MAVKVNFGKRTLEAIEVTGKRCYYQDTKVEGLVLVVQPTGTKSFQIYRRPKNGVPVRHTLGRFPDLSVDRARQMAYERLSEMAEGKNPNALRRAKERAGVTLKEVLEEYCTTRKTLKASTIFDYHRHMKENFPDWADKPLQSLCDKVLIEKRYAQIAKRSKARANGAMRILRALFNYAAVAYDNEDGQPIFTSNPVKVLSQKRAWHHVPRRMSVLKPDQLKGWIAAVNAMEARSEHSLAESVRDWLLLLLFTGLRHTEALALKWSEVDLINRSFSLLDPKNRQPITLPLTTFTQSLLSNRKSFAEPHNPWVFPGAIKTDQHMTEPKTHYRKLRETSGIEFTPHDLRRTFLTIGESLDIASYTLKRLANHKMNNDITAGYIISDIERLRAPAQRITDEILRIASLPV